MTEKQLKEWADTLGISTEKAKELIRRGEAARKKDNRFEAKKGEGKIIDPKFESDEK